jgi:flagellar hook assembly protein FlgD
VQDLVDQEYPAGNYRVTWDGRTSSGERASTGVYFYRIQAEGFVESKKMLLLK